MKEAEGVVVNDPYLNHVVAQIPRVLSWLDRESFSTTYGALDRTYWAWKFTDFQGARFQEAAYTLAILYRLEHQGNPYFGEPRLLDWIKAIFENWIRLQYWDGSFDEAYPFEHSLAATAFTGFYLGDAFLLMKEELGAKLESNLVKCFGRAGDWLCRNDETHGVLSNHLAAAAAALTVINRIVGGQSYKTRAQYFLNRIYEHQSVEGWYEEYGGADPGVRYIGKIHRPILS